MTTKVFLLHYGDHDDRRAVAAFSTMEKAVEYWNSDASFPKTWRHYDAGVWHTLPTEPDIEDVEMDPASGELLK